MGRIEQVRPFYFAWLTGWEGVGYVKEKGIAGNLPVRKEGGCLWQM